MCTSCVRKGTGCDNANKHHGDWLYVYISEDMYLSLHGFTRWRKQGNLDAEPMDLTTIWGVPEPLAEGEAARNSVEREHEGNGEKGKENDHNNSRDGGGSEDEDDEDEGDDSDDDDDDD